MGKQEKRVLTLDRYEHGVVVNALNEMRNDLLEKERPTDIVDEVLLKVIDAPAPSLRGPRKVRGLFGERRSNGACELLPRWGKTSRAKFATTR